MSADERMLKDETLEERQITVSKKVLVLGGSLATALARMLVDLGYEALVADPAPSSDTNIEALSGEGTEGLRRISVLRGTRLEGFSGFPGRFQARLVEPGRDAVTEEVGAVIIAVEAGREDPFKAWALEPSEKVRTLSSMEELLEAKGRNPADAMGRLPRTCIFFCGIKRRSHPNTLRGALAVATALLAGGTERVILLSDHLKVADEGVERLSREAREAGVLFVKLTDSVPQILQEPDGLRVAYDDEALQDRVFVRPDLLVLEEPYRPAEGTAELAQKLEIQADAAGFFQGENVYNLPIFTNRTGVYVVGSGKGPVSAAEALEEAQAAALEVYNLLGDGNRRVPPGRIHLDRRRCAICLTCYRQCPHRAISILDRRPYFDDLACRACGICAAECPMDAIQLHRYADVQMEDQWKQMGSGSGRIVAFCCENSAYEAARLAALRGFQLPEEFRLIRVPCAGKVDENYLLSAMASGAEGVMVMACHHESCKSVNGSHMAERRVENMKKALEEIGVEIERFMFVNLAPGSGFDFVRAAQEMEERLRGTPNGGRTEKASAAEGIGCPT